MSKLTGKVAVVTGASKGIGAAIAKSLVAEGASVVVNYASSKAGADTVVAAITAAGGKAVAVRGDVSKAAEAQAIIEAAIKNYGRLDTLVNNSGVYEYASLEAITEEHFHRHFNINVLGLLLVTQAAVNYLGEGGSIINIGTGASSITPPNSAVYTGSKAAVHAITGVLMRRGANILTGGKKSDRFDKGYFFEPTVLGSVPMVAKMMTEEPLALWGDVEADALGQR